MPSEFLEQGIVQGHPQLTEEKIVGRLDFSKLSEMEKVIFSLFAQTPSSKIIDEINRIPEGTQNMLLNFVETGHFYYLNENIRTHKYPFFATANYKDEGNTDLTPPLLDRFDINVEVKYPIFLTSYLRNPNSTYSEEAESLKDEYQKKIFSLHNNSSHDEEIVKLLKEYEADYLKTLGSTLENSNIKVMKNRISDSAMAFEINKIITCKDTDFNEKLKKINRYKLDFVSSFESAVFNSFERNVFSFIIPSIIISEDAELFINSFFDHMNSELKISLKESSDHNKNYSIGKTLNNYSVRAVSRSVADYSRFMAFLKNENSVTLESVKEVLPYIIGHKTVFSDDYKVELSDFSDNSSHMLRAVSMIDEFYKEDFLKNRDMYKKLYNSISTYKVNDFIKSYYDSDNPLVRKLKHLGI